VDDDVAGNIRQALVSGAVGALRSQPELVKRLKACLPSASEADGICVGFGAAGSPGEEDEAEAFRLAAEAAALVVLASEEASAVRGPAPAEGTGIAKVGLSP